MIVTVPTLRNQMKNPKKNLGRQQGPEEKQISLKVRLPENDTGETSPGKKEMNFNRTWKVYHPFFGGDLICFCFRGTFSAKRLPTLAPPFFFRGLKWLLKVSGRGGSGVSQQKKDDNGTDLMAIIYRGVKK